MSETITYVDFFERIQSDFLDSLKQTQEFNLKTYAAFSELVSITADAYADLPTPNVVVEQAFDFSTKILETQKVYATQLAELATDAQLQFTGSAKRYADTTTHRVAETANHIPNNTTTKGAVNTKQVAEPAKPVAEASKN